MSAAVIEKQASLKALFDHWDVDSSGGLDKDEMRALMMVFQPDDTTKHRSKKDKKSGKKQAQLKVTEAQLEKTLSFFDADTDADVSLDEFKAFFLLVLAHKYNSFDADASGAIDVDELSNFVDDFHDNPGSKQKERHIKKLMKDIDADGNSEITLEEFETWVLQEIAESIKTNKSLPAGVRKMVDLNVAHVRVEGAHKQGVKKVREAKSSKIVKNIEMAQADPTINYEEQKKAAEAAAAASLVPDDAPGGWHMRHTAGLALAAAATAVAVYMRFKKK